MIYLVLSIAAIFVAYVLFITLNFGVLHSISFSYYKLQASNKGWVFTAFTWYLAASMVFIAGFTADIHAWTFFVAGSGAAFVGAATRYDDKVTKEVHYTGSGLLILFSFLGLGLIYGAWPLLYRMAAGAIAIYFLKDIFKNPIFWIEILAFVLILFGLLNK